MFFITYLRRELRRRMRQAIFIALGLALGIGLVVTVTAASAGVRKAQSDVLKSLYGVGTDVTVTGAAPRSFRPGSAPPKGAQQFMLGPGGAQVCQNGKCHSAAGMTIDHLSPQNYGPISQSNVAAVAALKDVKAAVGGLTLTDDGVKIPKNFGKPGSGSAPPDMYIPLDRAQALGTNPRTGKSLRNEVNTIYVTAASASDISVVQSEISKLLPHDTVTTAASLASQVTGTASSAAKLANDLGKWLSILVLIAAFAVASLLTMAAVARRVREFGTLKALGWRSSRIIAQVIGESVAIGIVGGAVGVALGIAGAKIIDAIAPNLTASIATKTGQRVQTAGGGGGAQSFTPNVTHTVAVPMSVSVTAGVIVVAVLLAIAGGLLAGSFGGWRIARLRPADALARVA